MELLEQEGGGEVINSEEKFTDAYVKEIFEGEKNRLIQYFNSPLAKSRFLKTNNDLSIREQKKNRKIEKLQSVALIGCEKADEVGVYGIYINEINSISLGTQLLGRGNKIELKNTIYHELLHCSHVGENEEDFDNLNLLELERDIFNYRYNTRIKNGFFGIKEQREIDDCLQKIEKYSKQYEEHKGRLGKMKPNDDGYQEELERGYILLDLIYIINDSLEKNQETIKSKKVFEANIKEEADRQSKYLSNKEELYPRLKLIQNFIFEKCNGDFSEENLKYFFQQVDNYQRVYPSKLNFFTNFLNCL
ncbi:MAG TPA: hypothetical protein PLW93_06000, partial [Candidatus Absconditabacterales bacterium]|nr:hypothetical protein [Candidatus Absconditabacterales bacterium]HNG97800.1 hypothetical protein [Candidatus Absconditabacterales bacterium]